MWSRVQGKNLIPIRQVVVAMQSNTPSRPTLLQYREVIRGSIINLVYFLVSLFQGFAFFEQRLKYTSSLLPFQKYLSRITSIRRHVFLGVAQDWFIFTFLGCQQAWNVNTVYWLSLLTNTHVVWSSSTCIP